MLFVAGLILVAVLGAGLLPGAQHRPRITVSRSQAFIGWAVAGVLIAAAILGILSIGLFILPFAALALYVAVRLSGIGRDALGALLGVGLVFVVIGLWHLQSRPCQPGRVTAGAHQVPACGGPAAEPWLAIGVALVLLALVGTGWFARRSGTLGQPVAPGSG